MPDQNSPTGVPGFTPTALPPPGGTTTVSPIGVPPTYTAPVRNRISDFQFGDSPPLGETTMFGTTPNSTQYMPGAQLAPASLPPSDVVDLKQQLYNAGLLTAKTMNNPAVWDADAAAAYSKVLGFANIYGLNATDAINYFTNNPTASSATSSVVSQANPIDINANYSKAAQDLTGVGGPAPQQFIDQYHAQESAAQHSRGATYTAPPDLGNAAADYINKQDPVDVTAYGVASKMQTFFDMLGLPK